MQEKEMTDEARDGFGFAEGKGTITASRAERRKNIAAFKKYLPSIKHEMLATQEAFDKNYPGELGTFTEDETWEFLEEENKTRKAQFFQRLFRVELYFTAITEYIRTNGMKDILQEMGMKYTENELNQMLADKLPKEPKENN